MSAEKGFSSCCLSGKLQTDEPKGRIETIGGLPTYVADAKDKSRSIIFITDIFGWELPNVRLLADQYAAAGFHSYVPDFHSGNSLPHSFLQNVEPPLKVQEDLSMVDKAKNTAIVGTTLGPWLVTHREGVTRPMIDGYVNTVRRIPGTNSVGAIGFCWGGRYAILQAHGPSSEAGDGNVGGVDAAVAMHPALLSVPGDFEKVTKPLSIGVGTKDSLVDESTRNQIKEVLSTTLKEVPTEVRVYDDQVHGFSLRGDYSHDKDKEAMDEAVKQGLEWFDKYLPVRGGSGAVTNTGAGPGTFNTATQKHE